MRVNKFYKNRYNPAYLESSMLCVASGLLEDRQANIDWTLSSVRTRHYKMVKRSTDIAYRGYVSSCFKIFGVYYAVVRAQTVTYNDQFSEPKRLANGVYIYYGKPTKRKK